MLADTLLCIGKKHFRQNFQLVSQ